MKVTLGALGIVLVLVDVVVGYRLWNYGWPKRVTLTSVKPDVERIDVLRIPFTGFDWLILVLVLGFHAVLFYLVWKAWHSSPVPTHTAQR
jgi:hypothetical protein